MRWRIRRLEFVPNVRSNWDQDTRGAKEGPGLVLIPMPASSTRTAHCVRFSGVKLDRGGRPPDAIDRGCKGRRNADRHQRSIRHNWTYKRLLSKAHSADSAFAKAANYALNREGHEELLNGLMLEGYSTVPTLNGPY